MVVGAFIADVESHTRDVLLIPHHFIHSSFRPSHLPLGGRRKPQIDCMQHGIPSVKLPHPKNQLSIMKAAAWGLNIKHEYIFAIVGSYYALPGIAKQANK